MIQTWQLQEAKNNFSQVVVSAIGEIKKAVGKLPRSRGKER